MDLDDLRIFLAVVRRGTLTAAMEDAHLSQPALSRRLQRLERSIGTKLFERVGRGLKLTPAGAALQERASTILAEMSSLPAAVAAAAGEAVLRIGGSVTACTYLLPPVLRDLRARRPSVAVTVRNCASVETPNLVLNREIDVGITSVLAPVRGVRAHHWQDLELVLIGPPGECCPRLRLEDLHHFTFVLPSSGTVRTLTEQVFLRAGRMPPVSAECDSLEVVRALVASGSGFAIIPSVCVGADSDDVAVIQVDHSLPRLPVAILAREEAQPATNVAEFLESVVVRDLRPVLSS